MKTSQALFLVLMAFNLSFGLQAATAAEGPETSNGGVTAPKNGEAVTGLEEIVVTARRREETALQTPVVLTALSGAEIERRQLNTIDKIALSVPGLITGEGTNSAQGGSITIRGIAGSDLNVFGEQAVSFNVDGVPIARGNVRRFASFDISQVEVLKGPQALFFGKNSPGGILAVKTADPTASLDGKVSAGYEFNGREFVGDGYISGPVGEDAGFRLAAFGRHLEGYLLNAIPPGDPGYPGRDRYPLEKEYAFRGTFKYGHDRFDVRAKMSYGQLTGTSFQTQQLIYCPLGHSQLGSLDNCKADKYIALPEDPANFAGLPGFRDGVGYQDGKQALGSLEMNYDLSGALKLSSITGYYYGSTQQGGNATAGTPSSLIIGASQDLTFNEVGQELRLTSSFDAPVNFMVGGYYNHSLARYKLFVFLDNSPAIFLNGTDAKQSGNAYSVFAQGLIKLTPTIELSGGGRYSWEDKSLPITRQGLPLQDVVTPVESVRFTNFSPEATLSWRPTTHLTVFGSYKTGFLSGGFNAGNTNLQNDVSYKQQTTKGGEAGLKAALFGDTVRVDLAGYSYNISGLQVTRLDFINGVPFQSVINAGKARTSGAEADLTWQTPVSGLRIHSAAAYNDAHYVAFTAPCYTGQTTTSGCMPGLIQDLAGKPLVRAPKWTLIDGVSYDFAMGHGLRVGLSSDVTFRSRFITDTVDPPVGSMPAFALLDSTVRLGSESDSWELALVGTNLTNKYWWIRSNDAPLTGSPATGTAPDGPGTLLADRQAAVNRGRQIMLRGTYHF